MTEFKFGDMMPVEAITNELWSVFDILRIEPISSDDYQIVLFLLSLYKDGYLKEAPLAKRSEVRHIIERSVQYSDYEHREQYTEIYRAFEHSFHRLSDQGLYAIIRLLVTIDIEKLRLHFSQIFDNVLYRIAKSQGRHGGEFIQPIELTRLVISLASLQPNSSVYNPFAGVASFGVFLGDGHDYFGQEIKLTTWAIGALRILAYERGGSTVYVKDNSVLNWAPDNQKFELIVSNPPYRMRLDNEVSHRFGHRIVEQFLIDKGISSLSRKGKLIAILPNSFLSSGGAFQHLREYLLEKDYIDTVISLPGGLLMNTGMPLTILVINKAKDNPGYITFVDASDYVEGKGLREKRLNDYGLYSVIKKGQENKSIRIVSNEKVRKFGYNLNVPRYFQREFDGVRLAEILEYVHGFRTEIGRKGKLIRIRDLKDDKLDYYLDVSYVEETNYSRPLVRLIDESCLLLAIRWKTLKPTFFHFEREPVLLPNDIVALKVNEAAVDIGYLINELHADYVEEQVASYRIGDTIPFIRRDDLLEIKIKLPPLNEQKAKVQGLSELSNRIKSLQAERNALAHGKSASRFNEFASLKHTLGRPRQNILDWSDNLLAFLKSKSADASQLNKAFAEFYDIDMIAALQEIKRDINFMSEVLEKGENGLVLEDYPLELLPLSEINSLINGITHNGFKFKIKKLPLKADKLKEKGVEVNRTLLKTLIDNLLTNANKHGFISKEAV